MTFAENRTLLQGKCLPAGGHQSLAVLSEQFKLILREYLDSNDKSIVFSRVLELKVPHYNHEFVYQVRFFNKFKIARLLSFCFFVIIRFTKIEIVKIQ